MGAISPEGYEITETMKEIYLVTGCSYSEIRKALLATDNNLEEACKYLKDRYHVKTKPFVSQK